MISLDRCGGSCSTLNDLTDRICVPIETKDVNIIVFNKVARINESKPLVKYIGKNRN